MFIEILPKPAIGQAVDIKEQMSTFNRPIKLPNFRTIHGGAWLQCQPRFFREWSYGGETDARSQQKPVRSRPNKTGQLTRIGHKRKIICLQQMHMLAEFQSVPCRGAAKRLTDVIP